MDGPGLSNSERQILSQIETALGQDRRLARRLRTFRPGGWTWCLSAARRIRGWALAVLTVVSVCLLVGAIQTASPGLIAAFAATWAVTLLLGLAALRAWTRRPF
jgi:hypothetical protein